MKPVLAILLAITVSLHAFTDTITLNDGTILEKVTAVRIENGKAHIQHSGGLGRYPIDKISNQSKKEFKLPVEQADTAIAFLSAIKHLETTDGKAFENIHSIRIKPSFISFLHKDGASSVRLEKLSPEIQAKCGYNKDLADQFDKAKKQEEDTLAKAERDLETKQQKAALKAENIKARNEALANLYYTNYGSVKYWAADPVHRALLDSAVLDSLLDAGFTQREATIHMNRARFR